MRRSQRFGMFLGAYFLATAGCEPHHSFLRKKDEDELPGPEERRQSGRFRRLEDHPCADGVALKVDVFAAKMGLSPFARPRDVASW